MSGHDACMKCFECRALEEGMFTEVEIHARVSFNGGDIESVGTKDIRRALYHAVKDAVVFVGDKPKEGGANNDQL